MGGGKGREGKESAPLDLNPGDSTASGENELTAFDNWETVVHGRRKIDI